MVKVYFHEPLRICKLAVGSLKLEMYHFIQLSICRPPQRDLGPIHFSAFDASSISRTHPGTFTCSLFLSTPFEVLQRSGRSLQALLS